MPVNDSPTAAEAEINCALCCIAGITNSTAETVRAQVDAATGGPAGAIDEVFLRYARVHCGAGAGNTAAVTLPAQVAGMQRWLTVNCNRPTNRLGNFDNLLTAPQLTRLMVAFPARTDFIVMIGDFVPGLGVGAAHFLTATRGGGAYPQYRDYQLDVPAGMVAALAGQTHRAVARFGNGPSVTNAPMQAFADPTDPGDRYIALVVPQLAAAGGCCLKACYITTATCAAMGLPDDCDELQALRHYRDAVLLATPDGTMEVATYYASAPAIVAALDRRADAQAIYRLLYNEHIRPAAAAAQNGDHATAHALFRTGVERAAAFAKLPERP